VLEVCKKNEGGPLSGADGGFNGSREADLIVQGVEDTSGGNLTSVCERDDRTRGERVFKLDVESR